MLVLNTFLKRWNWYGEVFCKELFQLLWKESPVSGQIYLGKKTGRSQGLLEFHEPLDESGVFLFYLLKANEEVH